MPSRDERRYFLHHIGVALVGGSVIAVGGTAFAQKNEKSKEKEEEVTPIEDLAREHGLLNRVLLVYDEINRRLAVGSGFDPKLLSDSANIIRHFIEEYHEKLEEDHLFPRFQKAGKLTDLVSTLKTQHAAGRITTSQILQLSSAAALKNAEDRKKLEGAITAFVRMYRPHEAREDTILFPALRSVVSANEYDSLGEDFENKEHQLFGREGFEGVLAQVADIEKALGIYDLTQFTPR